MGRGLREVKGLCERELSDTTGALRKGLHGVALTCQCSPSRQRLALASALLVAITKTPRFVRQIRTS